MSLSEARKDYGLYDRPVMDAGEQCDVIDVDNCDVCGSNKAHERFIVAGLENKVIQCERCGTARFFPLPSLDLIASFYSTDYYGSTGSKFKLPVERLVRLLAARQAGFLIKDIRRNGRVLDVGCGRGTLLSAFARKGFEAHGFELSVDAAYGLDPKIHLRTGLRLSHASYPDRWFEAVVIWHVLEHLPDPRATIQEAFRILKPDGLLVVAVPNFSSWQSRWAGCNWFHLDLPRHLHHFTAQGLKHLLESCGFERTTSHHFSFQQNPFGWLQSALNKWGWCSRNALYVTLHGEPPRMSRPISTWQRLFLKVICIIGMPLALMLSIVEALNRQGGTVHIVARKPRSGS